MGIFKWIDEWAGVIVVLILCITGVVGGIYGITWLVSQSYAGSKYEVTITVQAVEQSSHWGEHTNLWVQVYGEQDITYKLIGYHDFEVGKTYKLVFIDEPYLINFIVWWFEIRGRVISIEQQP